MQEVNVKTHLIITDVHDEYDVNWCGRLMDLDPLFIDDCPIFVLVSSDTRMELNTFDLKRVEAAAKRIENYLSCSAQELRTFARITGNSDIHNLSVDDLCTINREISEHTNIPHA